MRPQDDMKNALQGLLIDSDKNEHRVSPEGKVPTSFTIRRADFVFDSKANKW